jgi:hypothetical protein
MAREASAPPSSAGCRDRPRTRTPRSARAGEHPEPLRPALPPLPPASGAQPPRRLADAARRPAPRLPHPPAAARGPGVSGRARRGAATEGARGARGRPRPHSVERLAGCVTGALRRTSLRRARKRSPRAAVVVCSLDRPCCPPSIGDRARRLRARVTRVDQRVGATTLNTFVTRSSCANVWHPVELASAFVATQRL